MSLTKSLGGEGSSGARRVAPTAKAMGNTIGVTTRMDTVNAGPTQLGGLGCRDVSHWVNTQRPILEPPLVQVVQVGEGVPPDRLSIRSDTSVSPYIQAMMAAPKMRWLSAFMPMLVPAVATISR
jgi:hypothetical protein